MSRAISNVVTTNTFQIWLNKTNELLFAMSNEYVTANTGGATTTGNGMVIGWFGANNLFANTIRGGNTSVAANLNVTSNVNFEQGMRTFNTTYLNVNTSTSGTGGQVVDSFLLASYRSAQYCLTIKNSVANGYQTSKFLVIHDGGQAYITEYAIVMSNNNLGAFTASVNATHTIITLTPVPTSTTVQGTKIVTSV